MAPTQILRDGNAAAAVGKPKRRRIPGSPRAVLIHAGRAVLYARLLATPTADRIWDALPLYGIVERWGDSIHFETPIETGRERSARWAVRAGEIAFWCEDDRVIIGFGPTPLSRPGEIRMPSPANIWAVTTDDVTALAALVGGERVAVIEADS